MKLSQVKSILQQTALAELFVDGMGCSEPIITKKSDILIDNFFIYLANKKTNTVSGPIARVGLQSDCCKVDYLTLCEANPFSVGPNDVIHISHPSYSAEDYDEYAQCYSQIREIAYHTNCSEMQQKIISDYLTALQKITAPEVMAFYQELAPSFFIWALNEAG